MGHKSHLCSNYLFAQSHVQNVSGILKPWKTQRRTLLIRTGTDPSGPVILPSTWSRHLLCTVCAVLFVLLPLVESVAHVGWPQGPRASGHCLSGVFHSMFGLAWSVRCLARPQTPVEVSHPRMGSIPCAVVRELLIFHGKPGGVSVGWNQSMEKPDVPL